MGDGTLENQEEGGVDIREKAWAFACGGPFPDPHQLTGDDHWMALALSEAMKGVGLSSPNPPVGCAIVKANQLLGLGSHQEAGKAHGEIVALADAHAQGADVQGATAYITLEPCCHHGRTPPCASALVAAGIARVVIGVRDPNPQVNGGGLAILKEAGLAVCEGVLGDACARFHAPFFKYIRQGLPWVTLKLAIGADRGLGPAHHRTPITSHHIQQLAHALRRASDGILVGRHTVEVDDPLLNDRWPCPMPAHRRFWRIVVDTQAQLSTDRRLWQPSPQQPVLWATCQAPVLLPPGIECLLLPAQEAGCSLPSLLVELGRRGVTRLLLEGGLTLAQHCLSAGLVDECHLFHAHHNVGGRCLPMELPFRERTQWALRDGTWQVLEKN